MGQLLDKAEGKVKPAAGAATGRRSLEAEGKGIFLRGRSDARAPKGDRAAQILPDARQEVHRRPPLSASKNQSPS